MLAFFARVNLADEPEQLRKVTIEFDSRQNLFNLVLIRRPGVAVLMSCINDVCASPCVQAWTGCSLHCAIMLSLLSGGCLVDLANVKSPSFELCYIGLSCDQVLLSV